MTAEDDYPATGSIQGPAVLTNEQYVAMCDEIDRLRATADYPAPVVDHDAQTVTFAVTFEWDRNGLHMDHCEVGVLAGDLHRLLVDHYRSWEQLKAVRPVRTYEPLEERHIGSVQRTVQFHE